VSLREHWSGVIVPRFWEETRHLSMGARELAAYLLTTQHAVPGFVIAGAAALAEVLNTSVKDIEGRFAELMSDKGLPGFVERDGRYVRLPKAAEKAHKPNYQVVGSWFRAWKALPETPLKWKHVESLRRCFPQELPASIAKAWNETFGTISPRPIHGPMDGPMDPPIHDGMDAPIHAPIHGPMDPVIVSVSGSDSGSGSGSGARAKYKARAKTSEVSAAARAEGEAWVAWFNQRFGRQYQAGQGLLDMVEALLGRGYTQMDMRAVAWIQHKRWAGKPDMEDYIRPSTLLRLSNFERYVIDAREALARDRRDPHAS
jgi:uncharacterized phage protein (TIGR02220 family)